MPCGEHLKRCLVLTQIRHKIRVLLDESPVNLLIAVDDILVLKGHLQRTVLRDRAEHTARAIEHGERDIHHPRGQTVAILLVINHAVAVHIRRNVLGHGIELVQRPLALPHQTVRLGLIQLLHQPLVESKARGNQHRAGQHVTRHQEELAVHCQAGAAALIPPVLSQSQRINGGQIRQLIVHQAGGDGILVPHGNIVIIQRVQRLLTHARVDLIIGVLIKIDELNTEVLRNGVSLHQQLVQEASLALCRNRFKVGLHVAATQDNEFPVVLLLFQVRVRRRLGLILS